MTSGYSCLLIVGYGLFCYAVGIVVGILIGACLF